MTVSAYRISPAAGRDLDDYVDHLLQQAGQGVALKFVECAKRSSLTVAQTPKMGSIVPTTLRGLTGLRKWRVEQFPKLLIFYQQQEDGIEIVRVLHAAQDWWSLLDVN